MDKDHENILHTAVRARNLEVIKYLVDNHKKEINVNVLNKTHQTPLNLAISKYFLN